MFNILSMKKEFYQVENQVATIKSFFGIYMETWVLSVILIKILLLLSHLPFKENIS